MRQRQGFGDHSRRIGSIEDRIRLLERRDIDELIILDVSGRAPRFEQVKQLIEPLFCPMTVGGGIKSIADIRRLLADGADKVAICSQLERELGYRLCRASEKLFRQAIVRPGCRMGADGHGPGACLLNGPIALKAAAQAKSSSRRKFATAQWTATTST
jgi:hypothetical protein